EYHLEPLDYEEVVEYIRHRLEVAGGSPDIFDDSAIMAIYYFSGGVPRLVNTLCDYALVHAYAMDKPVVGLEVALEVKKGRRIGGFNRFIKNVEEVERVRQSLVESKGVDLAEVS
ncbi:MAG: general secretion pathway protein, partial [Gammaproteobacteria bacterium]|nr:general secretion pathway protein [Gammaproteobacteria bacterium]